MSPSRFGVLTASRTARVLGLVAATLYLAGAVGIPLPLTSPGSTIGTGVAFPCQGNGCGCRSAGQCYRSCCCHTPSERLAWAGQHDVELDASTRDVLVAAAAKQNGTAAQRTCCHDEAKAEPLVDDHTAHGEHASCCPDKHHRHDRGPVLLIAATKCHGVDSYWTFVTGPTLPLDVFRSDAAAISHAFLPPTSRYTPVAAEPPIPPPRLAAV